MTPWNSASTCFSLLVPNTCALQPSLRDADEDATEECAAVECVSVLLPRRLCGRLVGGFMLGAELVYRSLSRGALLADRRRQLAMAVLVPGPSHRSDANLGARGLADAASWTLGLGLE